MKLQVFYNIYFCNSVPIGTVSRSAQIRRKSCAILCVHAIYKSNEQIMTHGTHENTFCAMNVQ